MERIAGAAQRAGEPRFNWVRCAGPHGLHRMAYAEWGDPVNPKVLVCVHGLTRNGRDFDFLAAAMASEYRVVCPDVAGRGLSPWLSHAEDYALPVYIADMVTLIARVGVDQVHWVGTSMGGLIGMGLASLADSPITKMVLNDVGPAVTRASMERIGEYLGKAPTFDSIGQAEQFIRFVSAPFGRLTDAQWRHLTLHSLRELPGGRLAMAYDPAIAVPFRTLLEAGQDIQLWPVYDAVTCPTLLMRGAESDLLTHETALEMTRRGPRAKLVEIAGVGHAPMMFDEEQIGHVRAFLLD